MFHILQERRRRRAKRWSRVPTRSSTWPVSRAPTRRTNASNEGGARARVAVIVRTLCKLLFFIRTLIALFQFQESEYGPGSFSPRVLRETIGVCSDNGQLAKKRTLKKEKRRYTKGIPIPRLSLRLHLALLGELQRDLELCLFALGRFGGRGGPSGRDELFAIFCRRSDEDATERAEQFLHPVGQTRSVPNPPKCFRNGHETKKRQRKKSALLTCDCPCRGRPPWWSRRCSTRRLATR